MNARDRMPALARFLAGTAVCVVAAVAGCGHDHRVITDEELPPPPISLPRTSPANLLHNLKLAYERRNLAEYDSLLAEDFIFILSEEDQQKPDMPDLWRHDTEVQIHTRMFDTEYVQVLTLAYEIGDSTWDAEEGKYAVVIQRVNLYLYGSTPGHPTDVKEYRISDSRSRFWFRRNGWLWPGTQDSVWTIVMWQDNPVRSREASAASSPATWGMLKAIYQ